MCDTEEQILDDLKKNYTKLGHPLFFSGITQIQKYYKGCLSTSKIKEFLSSVYSYTIHKESHDGIRNPYFIRFKRQQWQIDLIEIRNVKAENGNYCYIMTCIDVFSRKY